MIGSQEGQNILFDEHQEQQNNQKSQDNQEEQQEQPVFIAIDEKCYNAVVELEKKFESKFIDCKKYKPILFSLKKLYFLFCRVSRSSFGKIDQVRKGTRSYFGCAW